MKLFLVCVTLTIISVTYFVGASEKPAVPKPEDPNEDERIINETIAKYGLPLDYKKLDLPGPELLVDGEKDLYNNKFEGEAGNYTLRIRTIAKYFSYNGRYEEACLKKVDRQVSPVVKGQFGEHFERKNGGYYIRTIGYTIDANGYRKFLIDLTSAQTTLEEIPPVFVISGGPPGAPSAGKGTISSTVLGTLIGGNSLG